MPKSNRRIWLRALGLLLFMLMVRGLLETRLDPQVHRITIALRGLPAGTRPLRLVLASDIHVGNLAMPVSRLDRIVDQINAQHADAILLAGDFVNGYTAQSRDFHPDAIVAPLSRLKAPWGKFAVMGNHDAATAPERVESALARAGITMLNNRATRIGGIALIGLDDVSSQRVNFARGLDSGQKLGGVPVVMAHSPEVVSVIPLVVPLIMTGHTHCGEIRAGWAEHSVDLWHWVSHDPQNLTCGLVHEIGRDVIVTGGVGASSLVPIRLNAPPDFWVITLVPAPSKPGTPLSRKRGAPISMP